MKRIQINTLPGFENIKNYYWAQEDGRIWSDYKQDYLSPSKHYNSNELRDQWKKGLLDKEPYYILFVGLHRIDNPNPQAISVHKIIATAFCPNPNSFEEINHIDKDTSNNHYTNLEWIQKSTNIKIGLSRAVWQCDKITHQRIKKFNSFADIERETGFNHNNIVAVCKGRRKSASGFFWEYDN